MSLRPNIAPFDCAKLVGHLGSGDRDLLDALAKTLEERPPFRDPGQVGQVRQILERAVLEGGPFPGLEAEKEAHVAAANLLAQHDQEMAWTNIHVWGMGALDELWNAAHRTHSGDPARLAPLKPIYRLATGRPLFGRSIRTGWSHYAFLTNPQVATAAAGLREFADQFPDKLRELGLEEFHEDLAGILAGIGEGGRDLWFLAS